MKRKISFLLLSSLLLLFLLCSCESHVNELKEMIPDVKRIFEDHYPLIQDVLDILQKEDHGAKSLVRHYDGGIRYEDSDNGVRKLLFSGFAKEEQDVILALFAVESNGVQIEGLNIFRMDIAWRNLTRLDVLHLGDDEEQIEWWRNLNETAYFEEVYDGWYAMIIVSPPI